MANLDQEIRIGRLAAQLAIARNLLIEKVVVTEEQGNIFKAFEPDIIKGGKGWTDEAKQAKIKKVMDEWKAGTLKSGSGEKVTDQKQALAIAYSYFEKDMSENDLEKSDMSTTEGNKDIEKSLVHKYYARKPRPDGKGWIYYYTKEEMIKKRGHPEPLKFNIFKEEFVDEDTGEVVSIDREKRVYSQSEIDMVNARYNALVAAYSKVNELYDKNRQQRWDLESELDELNDEYKSLREQRKQMNFDFEQDYVERTEKGEVPDTVANEWGGQMNELDDKIEEVRQTLKVKTEEIQSKLDKLLDESFVIEARRDKLYDRVSNIGTVLSGMVVEKSKPLGHRDLGNGIVEYTSRNGTIRFQPNK